MKLKSIIIGGLTALTVIAPVATVVACGSKTGQTTLTITSVEKALPFTGTIHTGKIAAIVSDPENPRWQKAKTYFGVNLKAMGFTAETNIIKNAASQKSWLDSKQKSVLGAIVGATDNTAAGAFASYGSKPIIAYDRLIKSEAPSYNWYVTYDNIKVGELQGLAIVSSIYGQNFSTLDIAKTYVTNHKLSANKLVVALGGDPADNNAGLFYNGAKKIFDEINKIDNHFMIPEAFNTFEKVAQNGWNYATGKSFLQTNIGTLTNKDKIAAVLAPNDGMATSAIQALKENGLDPKTIYITGQDSNDTAIKSIFAGSGQNMTISKPDSIATAVASSLMGYLLSNLTKANKRLIDAGESDKIIAHIKSEFGDSISVEYDNSSYETSTGKHINTLKLTPKVVTKANLSTLFKVTK